MSSVDIDAQPLRWWTAAALSVAGTVVGTAWQRWCDRWAVSMPRAVAVNACDGAPSIVDSARAWTQVSAQERAWVGVTASPVEWTRGLLFGPVPPSVDKAPREAMSLADQVAARAWQDLKTSLAALLPDDDGGNSDAGSVPPACHARPWSGAMAIRLLSADDAAQALFHLSPQAACRIARLSEATRVPGSPAGRALRPVLEAIGERQVRVSVELDVVTLDFRTLSTLRCGDVLELPHRLDEALHVRAGTQGHVGTEGSPSTRFNVCAAVLGARDGRRAVELIHQAA